MHFSGDIHTISDTIQLTIDHNVAAVNGQPVPLEQPAVMINQTTMVPLRFIAESLHQNVAYDDKTQAISITDKAPSNRGVQPAKPQPDKGKELVKLDKITVDNLTNGLDGGKASLYDKKTVYVVNMVSDKDKNDSEMVGVVVIFSALFGAFSILFFYHKDPVR